jgi:hypothetical protein
MKKGQKMRFSLIDVFAFFFFYIYRMHVKFLVCLSIISASYSDLLLKYLACV